MNFNGKFNVTQKKLADQGQKALFGLNRNFQKFEFNAETRCQLFDIYVGSIISYGCEIWGFHKAPEIERLHLLFCKNTLGVRHNVCNYMIYRELGRYPLIIKRKIRIMKFWCKLLNTENCILKSSYEYLRHDAENYVSVNTNWARDIKFELFRVGLGESWISQDQLNATKFIHTYKNRILDIYLQECNAFMETSSKCVLYKNFVHHDFSKTQPYLTKPIHSKLKKNISLIRLSSHRLNVETGRYTGKSRQDRLCDVCESQEIEDEFHFILQCPKYLHIRKKYLNNYYYKSPSVYKLLQLLGSQHTPTLAGLGKYLHQAFDLRNAALSL